MSKINDDDDDDDDCVQINVPIAGYCCRAVNVRHIVSGSTYKKLSTTSCPALFVLTTHFQVFVIQFLTSKGKILQI